MEPTTSVLANLLPTELILTLMFLSPAFAPFTKITKPCIRAIPSPATIATPEGGGAIVLLSSLPLLVSYFEYNWSLISCMREN